jgi:2-phosphosulfolactate phosphatase
MRLRVDALPRSSGDAGYQTYADTVLVVDTLRATTTAGVYLEQGADSLYLCPDLETARAFAGEGVVLAGERNCLPPEGFDFGNSPLLAREARFDNRTVVMSTTNGTLAANAACETGKHVILASLRNAHGAARKARERSSEEIAILCAGNAGRVALEDVYTAGVLCEYLLAMGDFTLDDGAQIALTVRRQFADPMEPLSRSRSAENLVNVGLEADIAVCAEVSSSTIVPVFTGRSGVALIFRAA